MKVPRSRWPLAVPVVLTLVFAVTAPAATAKAPVLMSPQCAPGTAHPPPRVLCDRRTAALRAHMQSGSRGSDWIVVAIALCGTGASAVVMMARTRVRRQRSRALTPGRPGLR